MGLHNGFKPASVELASKVVCAGTGLFCTHLLRWIIRRHDWLSIQRWRFLLLRVFFSALAVALIMEGVSFLFTILASQSLIPSLPPGIHISIWEMLWMGVLSYMCVILVWQGIYLEVQFFRRHHQAEAERWKLEAALASAELGTLRAQLNPHFLFNCLNGMRALVVEDPARAQHVITRLASVLRYSLQSSSTPTVTLERELQTVDDYLDLEAIRFEDRLLVRREIDPATLAAQVPPMVMQTLVENAIKYGVSNDPGPGEIVIASSLTNGELVLTITNNGHIAPQPGSTGLGLKNATDRLHRLFGKSASISLVQSGPDLVTAMIRLPASTTPSV